MKLEFHFKNGRLVTRDDFNPSEPRKSDGEWTEGGAGSKSAPAAAKAEERKVTLNKNALAIGGDEWNKKTSERLETEYELAKPDVEGIANAMDAKNKEIAGQGLNDPVASDYVSKLALEHSFPKHFDPLNETEGEDYKRTQNIASAVAIDRAAQLIKQRDLKQPSGKPIDVEDNNLQENIEGADKKLWEDWKASSTSSGGVVIQLAIADEFGGRMRDDALKGARANYGDNRKDIIAACNRDDTFKAIGGYEGVKAMLRAKWETTQWLLDKAGIDDLKLYRAVNMYSIISKNNKQVAALKFLKSNKKFAQVFDDVKKEVAASAHVHNKASEVDADLNDVKEIILAACYSNYNHAKWGDPDLVKTLKKSFFNSFVNYEFWNILTQPTKQKLLDALAEIGPIDYVRALANQTTNADEPNYTIDVKASAPNYDDDVDTADMDYKLLPNLSVMRNGAASTTTDPRIANDWGSSSGRVVLRAHVPRTAAISIPAYGVNIHSEHEVVIAGTAWHGWDAWLGQAPTFEQVALGGKPRGVILTPEQKAALQKVKDTLGL